jgi:hypothetical protein
MFIKKERKLSKNLDFAARQIVQVSGISSAEVDQVASSPFLFRRLQAAIAAEREDQDSAAWWRFQLVSRRAIPVMGVAAALSFGLFLYVNGNKPANPAFSVDAYLGAGDSGIDNLVIAEKRMTGEDVLKSIVSMEDREAVK